MTDRFSTHFENSEANRSQIALLELITILGRYRNDIYLVGGWAPYFLLKIFQTKESNFDHVGSIDIDLVIDTKKISENQYSSIVELITSRGYVERKSRVGTPIAFSFEKNIDGLDVIVDFLAREYGGTSKSHRHQRIDDKFLARKARGADLLPDHHITFNLEGYLPDGAHHRSDIKMANVTSILAMKGITISERYKEKDAYDIFSIISYYKNGPQSCIDEIKDCIGNGLIKEGMQSICEKFARIDSVGPIWASKFIEPNNPNAARIRQMEIYQKVLPFIEKINEII